MRVCIPFPVAVIGFPSYDRLALVLFHKSCFNPFKRTRHYIIFTDSARYTAAAANLHAFASIDGLVAAVV